MNEEKAAIKAQVMAHPFLAGMPANHLSVLADCAQHRRFQAGEMLFRAGDPANGFFLVETGEVAIDAPGKKRPVMIDVVAAGGPLGWSWIFEPYRWQYDARATQATTALFFPAETLRDHQSDDGTFGHELFKRMCEVMVKRLQAARGKLADALED